MTIETEGIPEALPKRQKNRLETLEEAKANFKVEFVNPDDADEHTVIMREQWNEAPDTGVWYVTYKENLSVAHMAEVRDRLTQDDYLEEICWWLRPEIQEAVADNRLKEKLTFMVNDKELDFYCFDRGLSKEEIAEVQKVLEVLVQVQEGLGINIVQSVVMGNRGLYPKESVRQKIKGSVDSHNPFMMIAEFARGRVAIDSGMIMLRDRGSKNLAPYKSETRFGLDKQEKFAGLAGTLAHEIGHLFEQELDKAKWIQDQNWLPNGLREKAKQWLKRASGFFGPTMYAGTNPQEDFAETFKYFLLDPSRLDPLRRDFMIDEVLAKGATSQPVGGRPKISYLRYSGDQITFPKVEQEPIKVLLGMGNMPDSYWESKK